MCAGKGIIPLPLTLTKERERERAGGLLSPGVLTDPHAREREREREIECGSLSFSTMGKPRSVHAVQSVHAVPACANSLNRAGGHPGPFSGKLDPGGPDWPHNPSVFSSTHAVLSVRIRG